MSSARDSRISGFSSLNISYQEIKKEKWLGKGSFGTVFLGKWEYVAVAIKELDPEHEDLSEADQQEFEKEAQVMHELRLPLLDMHSSQVLLNYGVLRPWLSI